MTTNFPFPTETIETNRDKRLNNRQRKIVSDEQMNTVSLLLENPQLIISTNTDRQPITTNDSNETIQLPKLILLNQPKRFRHNRETKTIGRGCPAIQIEGAPQRTPLLLEIPENIRDYPDQQFYIGIHVTNYKGEPHAQTVVTLNVKKNDRSELIEQEEVDEFDFKTAGVFSKINTDNLIKEISLLMFNLKQDDDVTRGFVKKKKLNWSRLKFAIYIKLSNDQYERVSPPIFSDLIKNTRGAQSVKTKTILPNRLCERGGQMIFIPLPGKKVPSIRVCCNGTYLNNNKFQIAGKILSFESPARLRGRNELHIVIYDQKNKPLTSFTLPYDKHGKHMDPCGVVNDD